MTKPGEPLNFEGRLALITGGGSGVGYETARLFIESGANVVLVGRSEEKLVSAASRLGSKATTFQGDVTNSLTAGRAFASAQEVHGRAVDLLINNAGIIARETAENTGDSQWQEIMNTNINGVFFFSREYARQAVAPGAIVNVSSTCGQVGVAGLAAYCTSKGAVDQLTRCMALELAERDITVNAVAPGAIDSPMLYDGKLDGETKQSLIEDNITTIPIGRVAEASEVARAIKFLASERHVTGTILSVDGGYTAI